MCAVVGMCGWYKKVVQFNSFVYSFPVFPKLYIEEVALFVNRWIDHISVCLFMNSLFCSIDLYACFCARFLCYIFTCSLSDWTWTELMLFFFLPVALYYSLKSQNVILPDLSFVLKIIVPTQGLLCFHTNFRITCSSSVKNTLSVLIQIAWNL